MPDLSVVLNSSVILTKEGSPHRSECHPATPLRCAMRSFPKGPYTPNRATRSAAIHEDFGQETWCIVHSSVPNFGNLNCPLTNRTTILICQQAARSAGARAWAADHRARAGSPSSSLGAGSRLCRASRSIPPPRVNHTRAECISGDNVIGAEAPLAFAARGPLLVPSMANRIQQIVRRWNSIGPIDDRAVLTDDEYRAVDRFAIDARLSGNRF